MSHHITWYLFNRFPFLPMFQHDGFWFIRSTDGSEPSHMRHRGWAWLGCWVGHCWICCWYLDVSRGQVKHPTAPEAMRRRLLGFGVLWLWSLSILPGQKSSNLSMPCNEAWLLQEAKVTPGRIWLDLVMDPMYFRGKNWRKILINWVPSLSFQARNPSIRTYALVIFLANSLTCVKLQESCNAPLGQTLGKPPSQLWKISLLKPVGTGLGVCSKGVLVVSIEEVQFNFSLLPPRPRHPYLPPPPFSTPSICSLVPKSLN